ncbi:AAA family ATPase [Campylobacter sp. Cr9]|uniref:McrB family protein n=1 Tax=Campylobacter sp. Cr9 TaxID=2735728 RepID=UPI00301567EB|nr:AAA family ATPase [Campylobacter sp. Cr9]
MNIYLRRMFKHDQTSEISVISNVCNNFFNNKKEFYIKGKYSGYKAEVEINTKNGRDPRFGKEFKQLVRLEYERHGKKDIEIGDIIVIYKKAKDDYLLEVIIKDSREYEVLNTFFIDGKQPDRHALIVTDEIDQLHDSKPISKPHQRIFFGAPGTGKSYLLNKEAGEYFGDNYERVTFHPNYFYSHFVGSYKPFPKILKLEDGSIKKDEDGNIQESITYKYIEGILLRVLLKAFKNPSKNYLLIIEEINRADVAAVFGDMFQLLDRNEKGCSEYSVATSKEMQEFLKLELDGCSDDIKIQFGDEYEKISFPNNFYIWATMNSADQGVMPLDTAFKRRWNFEYMDINSSVNDEKFKEYCFKSRDGYKIRWDDFRTALNEKLLESEIPEDKLLGPYFVSKSVLDMKDINERTKIIKDKVLMYLYEDVVKTCRDDVFSESKSYSIVCNKFNESVLELFKLNRKITEEPIKADNEDN